MGCTSSILAVGRKKKSIIPEVALFVPSMRIPVQSDLRGALKGLIPQDLANRLSSSRNQIVLIAEDTDGYSTTELHRALEEYLPVLLGLTEKEYRLNDMVEFKWKNHEDGRQEICVANSWFELLSIIHTMSVLTLSEANSVLVPKDHTGSGEQTLSTDCKREAIDLLLKAASYLEFCVRKVMVHIPSDIKLRLPKDLQENVLEAISLQVLGQGTGIQLGLAVESQNATLSVRRRLACEQLSYFSKAHFCLLLGCETNYGFGGKHAMFIKWKYLEAKAAAYYYHGLILDKGTEPSCHVSALCCFLAAEELLSNSKKACLNFCLATPVVRALPPWDAMKHLLHKIPQAASKKSQMYGHLLEQEKSLQMLPDLPEFQLSLRPDEYEFPVIHPAWDSNKCEIPGQTLKEHLKDCEDRTEIK